LIAHLPHPKKEEPHDFKPAADTQMEYSYDYFYSQNVGAVKKKKKLKTWVTKGIVG